MKRNVGPADRVARGVASLAMIACAVMAPLPLGVRVVGLSVPAVYMLFTALWGRCVGYRLMGKSTCPVPRS